MVCGLSPLVRCHYISSRLGGPIRSVWLICICLVYTADAVKAQDLVSEITRTRFIATSRGIYAAMLNPAGLAINRADDGILLNHNASDQDKEDREWNFLLSMGNLGFAFQRDWFKHNEQEYMLNLYKLSLAVGNRIIAMGSTTKWIETTWADTTSDEKDNHTVDLDIGVMFRPSHRISLAAMVSNPAEAEITEGHRLEPVYCAGLAALLAGERVMLNAEGQWTEDTDTLDDVVFRAGGSIYPVQNLNLVVGWQREKSAEDTFWIGAYVALGGISVGALVRTVGTEDIVRLSGEFRAALQTVTF